MNHEQTIKDMENEIRLKKELLTTLGRIADLNYTHQDNTKLAVKLAQKVLKDNDCRGWSKKQ